jgi:hypothetical protein
MKNKKAFLLAEETLKIVLAVISIGFLVYFLSALYFTNQNSKDLELAKASLESLIESTKNSEINEVLIYNPEDWVLISFSKEKADDLPNSCSNFAWDSCICLTDDINFFSEWLTLLPWTDDKEIKFKENSDEEGTCLKSEYSVQGRIILLEELPITLQINHEEKIIS